MTQERRNYLANIGQYLEQLSILLQRQVSKRDLETIEQTNRASNMLAGIQLTPVHESTFSFGLLATNRFTSAIQRLQEIHDCPVSIWLPLTRSCGTIVVEHLDRLRFGFPFDFVNEGILSILCSDLANRCTVEWEFDEREMKIARVELAGPQWGKDRVAADLLARIEQ